jgi:hypothetical protein
VLVALPTGEANQLSISKERKNAAAGAKARADRAFNELDNNKR